MIGLRCVVLLLLVALFGGAAGYTCEEPNPKEVKGTCVLQGVTLLSADQIANVTFPSAVATGLLKLVHGNVSHLSVDLARKLADVQDLTVDGMGIGRLVVWPTWRHLSAQNNTIAELVPAGADLFGGLPPDADQCQLRTLYLQRNALTSVPPFGRRFRQLQVLALDDNRLKVVSLDSFEHLEQLQTLSLAGNRIFQVVAGEGVQLLKLKHLSLAGNRLLQLDVSGWRLEALESLDLSGNSLYRMDVANLSLFPALADLRYAGNDWNCEWLSALQRSLQQGARPRVTDRELDGRCAQENLLSLQGVCCYEPASEDFSQDLFGDRWEQLSGLQRRYDLVQFAHDKREAADLNAVGERAHELRGNVTATLVPGQHALEGGLVRLRASLAEEVARVERLGAATERDLADVRQSIEELYLRATRPTPTLDAILQQSLADSIGQIERNVRHLRRRVLENLATISSYEGRMRQRDERIAAFEKLLAQQKNEDDRLAKEIAFIDSSVDKLFQYLDSMYKQRPADRPDYIDSRIRTLGWIPH